MSRYDDRSDHGGGGYYERERRDEYRGAPVRVASPPPVRRVERELPDAYYRQPVEDQTLVVRDDYRRTEERREVRSPPPIQGDMVLRGKKTETFARPIRRERSPSVERVRIREREFNRARSQSMDARERVSYVQRDPSVERSRVRIVERERERSPEPVVYRREERRYVERERSPSPLYDTERVTRRERTVVRERTPSPVYNDRERVTTRTREIVRQRSPTPPPVTRETTTNIRVTERERELVRRSPSPSPIPSPEPEPVRMVEREQPIVRAPPIHQEIITHHRHIDHGFEYQPVMVPAPMPTPPPRARTPTPPRVRQEIRETDIDIRTGPGREADVDVYTSRREVDSREVRRSPSRERRRTAFHDDDYLFERERERERDRVAVRTSNQRSVSVNRNETHLSHYHSTSDLPRLRNNQTEEDYYARKVEERSRIGEAYNGATKGWEIVDVPPGTERVLMEGAGGGANEITWQKYNGVRRSKFIPEMGRERDRGEMHTWDERRESARGGASYERETETIRERDMQMSAARPREVREDRVEVSNNINISVDAGRRERGMAGPPPLPTRDRGMWTEITKDLVVREAIEELGYDYEETEFFFYVFRYLKYVSFLLSFQL